nr:substrate-binding domain-containing protein [Sneathiella chinensis]
MGVVIPSLSNPVFSDAVSGINEAARAEGYRLMFTSTEYNRAEEVEAVSSLLEYRVDGLILTVADAEEAPALDLLEAAGVPYTLLYNQSGRSARPAVTIDNVAAGREVAQHLLALGHQRLGMVSGSFSASDRAMARRDGFTAEIVARGFPAPRVLEVDFVNSEVEEALVLLMRDRDTAPTALFCSNDLLAISVIGALERIGLNVPEDVSVLGFDGIAIGTHLHPTLTTVVQPSRDMGQTATRQLLACLQGGSDPDTMILPYRLQIGESVGPAAKPSPTGPSELNQTK